MASIEPLGDKLSHFRRALGLTQLELALAAGVSERLVRKAERSRPIKRDFLDYLAGALGVDVREIAREPAAVASLVCWRRNLAAVNEMLHRFVFENDSRCVLDMMHPKAEIRFHFGAQHRAAGMRRDFESEFIGRSGVERFIDLTQEFDSHIIDRDVRFHSPIGDGDLLALRGIDLLTYDTGDRDPSSWVHVYELEDRRVIRIDEYLDYLPAGVFDR